MKEFKFVMRNAVNLRQFSQLCKDAFTEMRIDKRGRIETMQTFNRYYNLNYTLLQLSRMGHFIESGMFNDEIKAFSNDKSSI